jgi:predicted TIM-barrel fold metal-dependent hydrolase
MVQGRERPVEHDGSAEALLREMDAAGVGAALLVQTPWLGEDNRYFVDAMRQYPGRFVSLGWLEDPVAPDARERAQRQYDEDGFRGVRLHLTDARVDEGVRAGAAHPLFRWAQDLGVPVQFLNRVPTHPTILGVAQRFPDLTIIVDHLGHPMIEEAPAFASSEPFFELAQYPHVYVKVSNHFISSKQPYPWADLHAYQQRMFDTFGPRRLMWGSNWPMQVPEVSYQSRLDAVRRDLPAFGALSKDDQAWVLGGTARSLWPAEG